MPKVSHGFPDGGWGGAYHGEDGLEEGAEARVLVLGRDDEARRVRVRHRPLGERLHRHREVAVVLGDELHEKVLGERVRRVVGVVSPGLGCKV